MVAGDFTDPQALHRKAADPVPPTKDQDQDQPGDRPEDTHDLLLADGSSVGHFGGIPTHVAIGDRQVPVVYVAER